MRLCVSTATETQVRCTITLLQYNDFSTPHARKWQNMGLGFHGCGRSEVRTVGRSGVRSAGVPPAPSGLAARFGMHTPLSRPKGGRGEYTYILPLNSYIPAALTPTLSHKGEVLVTTWYLSFTGEGVSIGGEPNYKKSPFLCL